MFNIATSYCPRPPVGMVDNARPSPQRRYSLWMMHLFIYYLHYFIIIHIIILIFFLEDDGELGSRPFPPRRQAGVSNGWSCRSPGISSATRSSAVLGAACASAPGALYGDSGVWPAAAQPSIQSQRSSLVGGSAALPPFRSSTRDAGREMV
ncbi:hypothetical protein T492DRAFT_227454 [Pavlovales sp. CCMP2436]|nr:hypothetical protein T492DRAFT_227454 [Pavlovales sp. CCMP2436]